MTSFLLAATQLFSPLARAEGRRGLAVVGAVAAAASWAASLPRVAKFGLSPLTLAIALGMVFGNSLFPKYGRSCGAGVDFAKSVLLRGGIILYGFRVTLQQVVDVGWRGLVADGLVVCGIFALAIGLGRWLRVDRETAVLIGAGSGICGAAAVMAAEPVIGAAPAKVSVAVATVVVFGTASMLLYPLLAGPLGLSSHAYGLYAGSTVHEVAQVVAAAAAVSEEAAGVAVIVKMLRVMMLAPFLVVVSALWGVASRGKDAAPGRRASFDERAASPRGATGVQVPWFAVLFLLAICIHSTGIVPAAAVAWLVRADTALLAMAMAALGIRTQAAVVRAAGTRPIVLASALFVVLVGGGAILTRILVAL